MELLPDRGARLARFATLLQDTTGEYRLRGPVVGDQSQALRQWTVEGNAGDASVIHERIECRPPLNRTRGREAEP